MNEQAGFWLALGFMIAGLHVGIARDGIENWLWFFIWFIAPILFIAIVVYISMEWTGYEIGESRRRGRE